MRKTDDTEKTASTVLSSPDRPTHVVELSCCPEYRWQVTEILLLLVVVLASLAVRLFYIEEVDVLFDESFSLRMAEFGFVEIWNRCGQDTHPPFYFWLLKIWLSIFGTSVVAARSLSVLFGVATVAAVYLFVHEACRGRTALTSGNRDLEANEDSSALSGGEVRPAAAAMLVAILVALTPIHIAWSMQIRMYSLAPLLAALMSWMLVRTLNRDCYSTRGWAAVSGFALLLLYTHNYGLFSVAALYLYAFCDALFHSRKKDTERRWNRLCPVLISAFAVYQVFSFWLIILLEQRARVADNFWSRPLDWDWLGQAFASHFFTGVRVENAPVVGQWILQGVVLCLIGLIASRRRFDGYLVLAVSLPIAVSIAISLLMRNVIHTRYLIICNMFILVTVAVLVSRIPKVNLRYGAIVLAVVLMSSLCWKYLERRDDMADTQGMRMAVAEFQELRRAGVPMIAVDPMVCLCARVYAEDRDSVRAFGSNQRYSFFHGTAVMTPEDYLDTQDVESLPHNWLWTLDYGGSRRTSSVRLGRNWERVGTRMFRDHYVELALRLYRRKQ